MRNPLNAPWFKDLYQNHRGKLFAFQAVVFALVGFLIAYGFGGSGAHSLEESSDGAVATNVAAGPSMWTCSMHPQIRSSNPGDCPICGMDLIPVPTTSGGMRTLAISPETRALMKIASTPVQRMYVEHEIPMVGKVDYDETTFGYISAWMPGRLDRLYVDYTGVQVKKGDHMVSIYSPELYSAQAELIEALKYRPQRQGATVLPSIDLVQALREKLRLLGLTEAQVKEIEKQEKPTDHVIIYSPVSGIVIDKLKQEGEYVKTGERIYTVADLSHVWVNLDAYETDLPWIRYGQSVTVTTEAYPGEEFNGRIAFIHPVLNDKTRTVKVRVNLPNPNGKLKPDMFVHAQVRPNIAAGGKVMDASLAGKWISPMHPEIIKDEPGECDRCGMPLVRAESLGYVTPETDNQQRPLVIPYSAALVTGRRAIVYLELPKMPQGIEAAFQGVETAIDIGSVEQIRRAFGVFNNVLDRPYGQSGNGYARDLWNRYADRLSEPALKGNRLQTKQEASKLLGQIEPVIRLLREEFGPIGQPTYEGREIVLGPRAGNYYLVRHGLTEGQLVVTQGNFKIDAEIQIQAKPSMMTPQGGGGGGHDHGGGGAKKASGDEHAGHKMALPAAFSKQVFELGAAYEQVEQAIGQQDIGQVTVAFSQFGRALEKVDGTLLSGHARMQWKEFAMLLGNDVVEGRDAKELVEADRLFLALKGNMRRMRDQLGIEPTKKRHVDRIAVPPQFQNALAAVWERYLAIQKELAADQFSTSREALTSLESSIAAVDDSILTGHAEHVWEEEKTNMSKLVSKLQQAKEIKAFRADFKPLSEEIGVLAKSFGFGESRPIYEIHCPMAFERRGAVWYQDSDQVRNPYFGSTMLKCADRVERVVLDEPAMPESQQPKPDHSQH